MNNYGEIEAYNLIEFWESIPVSKKEIIINFYRNSGGMFDFREVYSGPIKYSVEHGPIYILDLLIVGNDIDILDLCFDKFLTYDEVNYFSNSIWAEKRVGYYEELIEYLKTCNDRQELVENLGRKSKANIYWKDYYFFLSTCVKEYYRYFHQRMMSDSKFINCCNRIFNHGAEIIPNLKLLDLFPVRSLSLEQMGVYLEKKKLFIECINLMERGKQEGWTNDFDKRVLRCKSKIENQSSKAAG
ncbi:MAG: hypothetical protein ACR2KX_02200 [Chitinophagaceae bacterium]